MTADHLDHDYFQALKRRFESGLIRNVMIDGIEPGLSKEEILRIEQIYNFEFPPDLRGLLRSFVVSGDKFPRWRESESEALRQHFHWPLHGLLFDIEHKKFWIDQWGSRPDSLSDALQIGRKKFAEAPVLIPIFSHRYLPATPLLQGNPVFSVYQTDVIHYGYDLADYFKNEFQVENPYVAPGQPREIEFWSTLVDMNV